MVLWQVLMFREGDVYISGTEHKYTNSNDHIKTIFEYCNALMIFDNVHVYVLYLEMGKYMGCSEKKFFPLKQFSIL